MLVRNPVVIHWVTDMDRALMFYRELFDVPVLSASPGWSVLDLGAVKLALHRIEPGQPEVPLADAGLNLEVDRLDVLLEALADLGGTLREVKEPTAQLPVRVALCRDPDGGAFELRQRVVEGGAG